MADVYQVTPCANGQYTGNGLQNPIWSHSTPTGHCPSCPALGSVLLTFGTVLNSLTVILGRYSRGMLLLSPVLFVPRHLQTTNGMNCWQPIMRLILWVYWSGLVYNTSSTIGHRYGVLRLHCAGWNVLFSLTSGFERLIQTRTLSY